MLSPRTALLLTLLAATLWAAPLTKYDQRQDGDLNAHIHLENFVILLIPGGLRGFNIAAKVAPGRKHLARPALAHTHAHTHAQGVEVPAGADAAGDAPTHGLKAPPYHVDIDATRRQPPLVLEITPGASSEEQHEVVIAESPAVLLPKRPSSPQPPAEAESESNGVPQGTGSPPPSTAATLAEAPKADPAPTRGTVKPKKPASPATAPAAPVAPAAVAPAAPAAPAADKPRRPAAAPAASDKPKRPAPVPAAEKHKSPAAAPAPAIAPPAPVSVSATSPAPAAPQEAPEAGEGSDAGGVPAPALSGGERAARVAALGVGLEAAPAGGAPCAHGGCVHARDPVGVYEDSLLKALSFGLEPAH